jgi:uncharacterized membrane protein (UPF0127 family)
MNNSKEATLIAILQNIRALDPNNIQHGPNSSALSLVEAVKSDGELNQKDINELVFNTAMDQGLAGNPEQIFQKNIYLLQENPDIVDDLEKFAEANNIDLETIFTPETLPQFGQVVEAMLQSMRKYAKGGQFEERSNFLTFTIGEKQYSLLIAKTEEEKTRGLSDAESMEDNEGMIFDYTDDPQNELAFTMEDTTIPLDIIFVDAEKKVISVQQGNPLDSNPITCKSDSEIIYVIEVNQNSGIKEGDLVSSGINTEELDPNKLHVLNEDGTVQASIDSGSRIFSRHSTAIMIKKAKKAFESKSDVDYKDLGRYVFGELDRQDERPEDYVDSPNKKETDDVE